MKIILIIPCYNEQENIAKVYDVISEYNRVNDQKLDYIVINDGSTDDSLKILQEKNMNHINLIRNLGIGGCVQTGYKYALENGYDIAVQFDGDNQHDINYVKNICEPIINGQADMCIGSRFIGENKSKFQSTFMRRLGKTIISFFIRILCRKKITDPTSGFRAINKDLLKMFAKEYPTEYPEPESTVKAILSNYRISEVPVNMHERLAGKSSIGIWKSIDYMFKVNLAVITDSVSFRRNGGKI